MAKRSYLTQHGDTVDRIAHLFYKDTDDKYIDAILDANDGLYRHGVKLPQGVTVTIPEKERVDD